MPFRRSPQAVSTQLDDSAAVVLHLSTQAYFRLNATAQVLWDYLDEEPTCTEPDLVDVLLDHFDDDTVTRDEAAKDVQAFVASMREADLIVSA